MPSHSDEDDLLYDWWPLPRDEHAAYWLRVAWDLIEDGLHLPPEVQRELTRVGVDVPEFTEWAEYHSEHIGYLKEN